MAYYYIKDRMYGKLMVIVGQRFRSRSPEVKGHDPDLTMASNEPSHIMKIPS